MATIIEVPSSAPSPNLVTITHIVYGLHALSLLIGVITATTIVGAFIFGVPSILAVIISYIKRGDARGSYLESHFRWQIRTFWAVLVWCVVGGIFFITLIGIPVALGIFFAAGIWAIYRIARGWLALKEGKAMYVG